MKQVDKRPRVCMLVMNDILADPRVTREATYLGRNGYDVVVVGIAVSGRSPGASAPEAFEAKVLSESGVLVQIKRAMGWGHKRQPVEAEPKAEPRVEANASGQSRSADLLRLAAMVARNIRLGIAAARERAVLYHAHDLDTLLAGLIASKIRRVPLLYDSHELYVEMGFHTALYKGVLTTLERFCIKRTARVVTVNESIARILSDRYAVAMPAVVMNCPESGTLVRPDGNLTRAVLYQGVYQKDRGLENLVRSAAFFLEGATLYMRGFGPLESILRNLTVTEGLNARIVFLPPVPMKEMVEGAKFADVGVVPYLATTMNNQLATPNKLFEYMAAGLAVAASDSPELSRILHEEAIGEVFDATAPAAIAAAINGLLENPEALRRMKLAAFESFSNRYNWSAQAKELHRVYAGVLS